MLPGDFAAGHAPFFGSYLLCRHAIGQIWKCFVQKIGKIFARKFARILYVFGKLCVCLSEVYIFRLKGLETRRSLAKQGDSRS